ncbi:MAG TPA: hypothetical protein GX708_08525 [Gallicola sp.]|nr:hypothetical protein [Gallicola sp.]
MDDILIIYQATLLVLKNFLPAVIFAVFGLAYIYLDEKRDKHKKRKRSI